eukprot:61863_1
MNGRPGSGPVSNEPELESISLKSFLSGPPGSAFPQAYKRRKKTAKKTARAPKEGAQKAISGIHEKTSAWSQLLSRHTEQFFPDAVRQAFEDFKVGLGRKPSGRELMTFKKRMVDAAKEG